MSNKNIDHDNDWDQFIIIDYDKCKSKNKLIQESISENKIKDVPTDFSINDGINKKRNKCNSFLDLLVNTSACFVNRVLFSLCYISIKYIYTI
jgi:hypothetical protein